MKPAGLGELQAAYEKLKQKLEAEGLFDEDLKKAIPAFPKKIGIVTAIGAAALKDMISVAERRFPAVELVIAPAAVQGAGAAESIVKSIKQLNLRKDIDVIIIGRGGGSIEDLWAFNEEIVAKAIFKSVIPVISAVGHEVDFTIADYVSDLRAPTPSVAMELATPDINEIFVFLNEFSYNSSGYMKKVIDKALRGIHRFTNSYAIRYPIDIVRKNQQLIDHITGKLFHSIEKKALSYENKISLFTKAVSVMDVQKTLKRGFVLVKQNEKYVTKAVMFNKDESTQLQFSDGEIKIKP
jgi:exodeoxyribonuclease VII large subunit